MTVHHCNEKDIHKPFKYLSTNIQRAILKSNLELYSKLESSLYGKEKLFYSKKVLDTKNRLEVLLPIQKEPIKEIVFEPIIKIESIVKKKIKFKYRPVKSLSFAENILNFRTKNGLSRPDLALLLGVGNDAVYRWETGKRGITSTILGRLKEI